MTDQLTAGGLIFGQAQPPDDLGELIWSTSRKRRRKHATRLATLLGPAALELLREPLRADLGDRIVAACERAAEVHRGLEQSRSRPDDPIYLSLAPWRTDWSAHPSIDVYVGETLLTSFELQPSCVLHVRGVELCLLGGRVVGVAAGTWSAEAALACNGHHLLGQRLLERPLGPALRFGDGPAPPPWPAPVRSTR
jgi:hypothetical protein